MIENENLPTTLYHYCSTEAFYSIVKFKQLWMSSLVMSNDSMEGKFAIGVASSVSKRKLGELKSTVLMGAIWEMSGVYTCLGLCLSEKRDLLSQWRGYASNGAGVCIGISTEAIRQAIAKRKINREEISIYQVLYDIQDQEEAIERECEKLNILLENGDLYLPSMSMFESIPEELLKENRRKQSAARHNLKESLWEFLPNLYRLKSSAFEEEAEWRVTRAIYADSYEGCKFRPTANKIVPYDIIDFEDAEKPFIKEVILGPKHETPKEIVRSFLSEHNMDFVEVEKSVASYR